MVDKAKLIVHEQTKSPIAEAYRTLRTNIQYAKVGGSIHTLMFTSAGPSEGKSTTAANTACAFAQSGRSVIIVDCDLRKPAQHRIFGARKKGVTNILVEEASAAELLQETEVPNLKVLASGPIPPNPSELLGSESMHDLISTLNGLADVVIFDTPPTVAVTDACVLASRMEGIILVLESGSVRPEMAQKAKELLQNAKGNILGVILNRVEIEEEHAYYYYYYGGEPKRKSKSG